jgi:signal transduction histidine kinase
MATLNVLTTGTWISVTVSLAAIAVWMGKRAIGEQALRKAERLIREELQAYARLDPAPLPQESPRALARRVCTTVAEHSAFRQVAMLMRDAEGCLRVVGYAGVDDGMAADINAWVARFARERRRWTPRAKRRKNCPITLGRVKVDDAAPLTGPLGCRQVVVLPLWSHEGEMLGALAVWPEGEAGRFEEKLQAAPAELIPLEHVLAPLETLAQKLGRAMDLTLMTARLLRAEKMIGLGQLANGVAHELNNPLTAVLGYAELIAETSSEPRVLEDAVAIVGQAMRMKDTVDSLLQFWQPAMKSDRMVNLVSMLKTLVERAQPEIARLGVRLVLETDVDGGECCVRGHEQRLAEVFEHLLSNAAQAVEAYVGRADETPSIRVKLTRDDERLRVVVSDSGAGFADAARVFEPFYTTRQPGEGQGLGLAVSYGIVREHGGEISAFNVHPHGAAVAVELPVARVVLDEVEIVAAA